MANEEHLARLKEGVEVWNQWREANHGITPDLSRANLRLADLSGVRLSETVLVGTILSEARLREALLDGADLSRAYLSDAHLDSASLFEANLIRADLRRADLDNVNLSCADLSQANLSRATLVRAYLREANLSQANLSQANLSKAYLSQANLSGADLSGVNLRAAILWETNLAGANLTGGSVYGIAVWNVHLTRTQQSDLVITREDEPVITVDNLEVAQFIYLLLHNEKIREVIDTITSKAVLILGRFTPERKAVLDAIREELRHRNYLPILFDFEAPGSRDFTETISTLAHMARFIIADLTDAKSIPQELQRIVPDLPSVPVQPLLQASMQEYGMFEHFTRYPWVLETYRYESREEVIATLTEKVIVPAEAKAKELLALMRR